MKKALEILGYVVFGLPLVVILLVALVMLSPFLLLQHLLGRVGIEINGAQIGEEFWKAIIH